MDKKFDYVLFDLDGTLIDSANCSIIATQKAFSQFSLEIPTSNSIIDLMGIPIETSFKDLGGNILSNDDFSDLLNLFRNEYSKASENEIRIFPGILKLLKSLKLAKIKTAIVTSKKTKVVKDNLQKLSIEPYFDYVIGSDKVSFYKPNPEGLVKAISYLGLNQEHYGNKVIYIGDAITDIKMAKSAHVFSCAVTWGSHSKEKLKKEFPDYIVENIDDLYRLLMD